MDSQTRKTKPKYEMIKETLLARIHAGDFSFDESFCTEKMLSEQHHVSRITAKRAIEDLEQQGILYRKRGVGSFVSRSLSPDSKATDTPKMISLLLPFATTQAGQTLERMDEVKHRWLPQVILAQNFEETWNSYMEAYNACDPQSYFEDLQKELDQRMNKKNSNFCILNDKN